MSTITGRVASFAAALVRRARGLVASLLSPAGCGSDDSGGSAGGGGADSAPPSRSCQGGVGPADRDHADQADRQADPGRQEDHVHQLRRRGVRGPGPDPRRRARASSAGRSSRSATDGSPEKVQGAFDAAIRDGADAVIINAADKDALAKPLADAKKAGVEFVTCCSLAEAGQGRAVQHRTPEQNAPIGDDARRRRSSPTAAARRTPVRQRLGLRDPQAVGETFTSKMKELCPDCDVDTIDIPLTSLGKDAPDRIVSYLRSHPNVNYVVLSESRLARPGPARPRCRPPASPTRSRSSARVAAAGLPGRAQRRRSRRSSPGVAVLLRLRDARRARPQVGPACRSATPARSSG